MKKEYDFSKGKRGRFYKEDATLYLPIYLDIDNRAFVEEIAARKNLDVSVVVNELIRTDRKIISTAQ